MKRFVNTALSGKVLLPPMEETDENGIHWSERIYGDRKFKDSELTMKPYINWNHYPIGTDGTIGEEIDMLYAGTLREIVHNFEDFKCMVGDVATYHLIQEYLEKSGYCKDHYRTKRSI